MRRALFVTAFLVFMIFPITTAWAVPAVQGQGAALIDGRSGQLLFEKDKDTRLPPASITKILTAIIAIESGRLDELVTVGPNPMKVEGTRVYIEAGEKVRLRDLVRAALIHSANDAALAIAEYLGHSEQGFAAIMNEKAQALGAENSNFVNPHGLHDESHYTTAYDMALISRYAMNNETFREIVSSKILDWQGEKWQTRLININEMLWSYNGANGIKTGYTKQAKNTIVASAVREDRLYIAVVIGSPGRAVWEDAQSLLDYGFQNFRQLVLADSENVAATIELDDKRTLQLVPEQSVVLSVPVDSAQKIEPRVALDPLAGSIAEGDIVGRLLFSVDGAEVGGVDLLAGNSSRPPLNISGILLSIGAGLFALQVLWRVYLLIRRRRRRANGCRRRQYYNDYNRIGRGY